MNPDDILPSAMDFRFNPVRETQWSLLLQTGKGMVSHIASAPDKAALDDSKLLLAQFALASSRQIVPIEDRAEWNAQVHGICEEARRTILQRSIELFGNG
jgi:hypothetical protein